MDNVSFRKHIKVMPKATLDLYFDQITKKMNRAKSQAVKLGCAQALDDLVCEVEARRQGPINADIAAMSDEDLLEALS